VASNIIQMLDGMQGRRKA